ncbi:MAG: tetratricopeptide repeat protein [Alteraurantiacibacter sp. bin_em_oilr2.035]|nr:tetratricopeptide repeat protein [Alteraurantiacibacter sp. bin_em_oilr2.035]
MKKLIRSASVLALALSLAACGLSPEERMDRAEQAFAENRFSEARLDLATILQENADDAVALDLLARTQLQLGDGEGAGSSLSRLAELGALPADLAEMLAEADLLRGKFKEALDAGNALENAAGARIAALAHVGLGDATAAQSAFESGTRMAGGKSRLLADYAIFMLNAGDSDAAERLGQQAREAAPDGLDSLTASARIAQSRGELGNALTLYEQAARIWPESRVALLGQIGVLGDLGRIEEARPLIEQVVRRTPSDPDVIYLQARLAAEAADWRQVRELLQPIEGREDIRQQLLYVRALIELDLPEQAQPRLITMVRRTPGNAEARRLLARAQLATGDAGAAFATIQPLADSASGTSQDLAIFTTAARQSGLADEIETALKQSPPSERVGLLLAEGDNALNDENWRGAIDAYEELRGWTGDSNAMVLNNLAFAHSRSGNPQEAIRLAELALGKAPDHPSIMDTLGWLLVSTGKDRSRGLLLLEQAAQAAPENAVIARHLAEARRG